jgi:hypothetical protein
MTTKKQNEALWRAIENYYGWLIEQENLEYENNNLNIATTYSNCSMELFDFLKEEGLYAIISEKHSNQD